MEIRKKLVNDQQEFSNYLEEILMKFENPKNIL